MIIRYPLINPAFDPPVGKTKELIDELINSRKKGDGHGGSEILAAMELLMREAALPNVNYLPVENSPIHKLNQEFLRFLCSFRSVTHPLLVKFGKRHNWAELPLFICGVGSATAGITAALLANGITSGEVITTSLNFLGVPNAIVLAGATPKFADINADDWCVDVKSLKKTVNKKTRAVVLVHFNQVVDLSPIDDLFMEMGLEIPLIQDASLAAGSTCQGMPAGLVNPGVGGATVYSFATSKILSGLGGAVVVAHDQALIDHIQSIAYQGQNFKDMEELLEFGANFKLNDLNAALVVEQLKKRDQIFAQRRHLKSLYDEKLADVVKANKIEIQKVSSESIVTHYGVTVPDRKVFAQRMAMRGIQVGMWHTIHLQKMYQERFQSKVKVKAKVKEKLPVTESLANRMAFLPFHTKLADEDVDYICKSLKEVI